MKTFKIQPHITLPLALSGSRVSLCNCGAIFIMSIKDKSKQCQHCKEVFTNKTLRGPKQWEKVKFCSIKCASRSNGVIFSQKHETETARWKGDNVGYFGVHDWMTKHYGQPKECEVCGLNDPNRSYNWANLSQKYLRDRNDFKRMCIPCHKVYDGLIGEKWSKRIKEAKSKKL